MKFHKLVLCLSGFLITLATMAQEVHHFTTALFLPLNVRYGREAIYSDMLAYQLYSNTLTTPVEDASYGKSETGEDLIWKSVTADTAHRLFYRSGRGGDGGFGRAGYYYLVYRSDKETSALLNVRGNSSLYFNGQLHAGDPYNSGWLYIPVKIKKGLNELYVRGAAIIANLTFPSTRASLNAEDPTLPSIIVNGSNHDLQGAVVVMNTSLKELKGLQIRSTVMGKQLTSDVPSIPPLSTRKVPFRFDASAVTAVGRTECNILLLEKGTKLQENVVSIEAVNANEKYSSTFISAIDGSLQYYAVAPQTPGGGGNNNALFLSVHGAGVEAIGQARAYKPKDWGTLVAATNRRPRGFNWEDWGRLDALEVLQIARSRFMPDPQRIYLTGHSMGGHGTWFLGATYPDKWAAIAPCAGYPTLKGYGSADGLIPDSSTNPMEQTLLRSSNQSDVIKLVSNYKPLGVYVLHSDADRTVSVNYARQMRNLLGSFHPDLSYYEYPGGSHWFGDQSVDWMPIFDFFKWHRRPLDTAVNNIDFLTSNPGISASYYWATIQQQLQSLDYSRIRLTRNRALKTIEGTTQNVRLLRLDLRDFNAGTPIRITLDAETVQYITSGNADTLFLANERGKWTISSPPDAHQKGPHRYGTLKDAFNHNMVFVYGTAGSKEENEWALGKARYDAETWYYRGNGAVDIIADKNFSLDKYKDRGVILYGNKTTNSAWAILLSDCPIQVERNKITAGERTWMGNDLAAYFVWPIHNSAIASVAVIGGTGLSGMNAAGANQYFAGASGFPDFMIFSLDMLRSGRAGLKMAGFFDHDWKLVPGQL